MDKRGDYNVSRKIIYFVVYIFFVGFIFTYIVALQGGRISVPFDDINEFNDKLIVNRLFESKDCFAYHEEGRVYTWILDFKKFNEENLKSCLYYGDYGDKRQVRVTLEFFGEEESIKNTNIIYNTRLSDVVGKDEWVSKSYERYVLVDGKYNGKVKVDLS